MDGLTTTASISPLELRNAYPPSVEKSAETGGARGGPGGTEEMKEQETERKARKLKEVEREVIAHERAHKSVGGQYAGAVTYKYQRGPDGKLYIVGGEVPLDVSKGRNPEETIEKMEKVKAAALAPANPSPQDLAIAAKASRMESEARLEMQRQAGDSEKSPFERSTQDPLQGSQLSIHV